MKLSRSEKEDRKSSRQWEKRERKETRRDEKERHRDDKRERSKRRHDDDDDARHRDHSRGRSDHAKRDRRHRDDDKKDGHGGYGDLQFPDAISVSAEFGAFSGLIINGDTIDDTGILISIANTSWGDGGASAFERRPDDHFTDDGHGLSSAARRAIADGQPYGIYELEIELPIEVLDLLSAPEGFSIEFEREDGETEIEFEIDLDEGAVGLVFDPEASFIPDVFEDPFTGVLQFFLQTEADALDDVYAAFVEVEAEFTWEEDGEVVDRFQRGEFRHRELEVETKAKIDVIPEPTTGMLTALGLAQLALRRRRAARGRVR